MSNQQWNSGQGSNEWAPQPQGSSNDWGQPAPEWGQQPQPQTSAQEWGQPQPQTSGQEWGQPQPQASGQEWGQQPQAAGNEWQQQPAQQDWNQQAQPDWGQQQGWQGQPAQGQPGPDQGFYPQYQQAAPAAKAASPFDLSFKQLSLPTSASLIFLVGVIALGVEWVFGFIALLSRSYDALSLVNFFVGGLAAVLFKVLILRVLIEIGVAAVKLTQKDDETPSE